MTRQWSGDGPDYSLEWGGRAWTLAVDAPLPGLRETGPDGAVLLGPAGVAARGRSSPPALSGATLVDHACRHGRVEATYAPLGWGELTVRASWEASGDQGVDLEVQVSARSVGELKALEVFVLSAPCGLPKEGTSRFVQAPDARSAGLSYDGREPDLAGLTTLPPRPVGPSLSRTSPVPRPDGFRYYAEMAHPLGVTRRITWGGGSRRASRYGLFGHDLERGVVLRARLRGLWLGDTNPAEALREHYRRFTDEPPPLGT